MVDSESKANQTRRRLLHTASQIVHNGGLRRLTLEAVAHEAHVSKGGLLYHFPSKDALMQGMVEHLLDVFSERLEHELAESNEPEGLPGRWLRAYLRATFATDDLEYELSAALAVAVAEEPALLETLKEAFQAFSTVAEQDGLPFELTTMVRLAADGLWFSEALRLSFLNAERRQTFLSYLIHLTYSPIQS